MRAVAEEALGWVERALGSGSQVTATSELTGGITSSVNLLSVESGSGATFDVVLRCWTDSQVPIAATDMPLYVQREADNLQRMAAVDLPTPELLAYDLTGEESGVPSLLMTKLRGEIDLTPKDPSSWLDQLASALPVIHAVPHDGVRIFTPWLRLDALEPPSWSTRPEAWRDAIAIARDESLTFDRHFIHRDWQHFNVLWTDGKLTGVVDWIDAAAGPPEIDVGHCRLNLAALYSAERAEDFLARYESVAGRTVDRRWDLVALLGHLPEADRSLERQVDGRRQIDWAGIGPRVEELVVESLRQLG